MWFLLVITVASSVVADAGYLYNTPNVPFSLPNNQPASNYPSYNFQRYNYNKDEGIKNYVYLNKNNIQNNNGKGILGPQHIQNYVTGHSNNGYGGYTQTFTPPINFNNNYAQSNWQHAVSPVNVATNVGYLQTPQLPVNSNLNVNIGSSYNNNYALSSVGSNQNSGYTGTLTAPSNSNYNNVYSQPYVSSAPVAVQNNYAQSFVPIGGNNLKSNFVNSATTAGTYNNGYAQTLKPIASVSLQNGNNGGVHTSGYLNNAYSQVSTTSFNSNSGHQHSFTPSQTFTSNNGFTPITPTPINNQLNSGISQSLQPPIDGNLNNGYTQSVTVTGNANLNSGYEHTSTSSNANVNGAFESSQIPNASGTSNSGYSDSSAGPTHIDLSSDLTQLSTSTSTSTSLQNSFSQTSVSSHSNTGLVQNNLEVSPNSFQGPVPTSQSVTPIIHKHIYFHIPPPEIEDLGKPSPSPSLPKKNYKILFIKMPSQESKSNKIRLQEQMQKAAVEDKTIIYVLVRKPEDPKPVVLPEPKPSQHQVFFVKYNESPFDIAARVNDEIDKTGSINSIVPLEPGLVNGHK